MVENEEEKFKKFKKNVQFINLGLFLILIFRNIPDYGYSTVQSKNSFETNQREIRKRSVNENEIENESEEFNKILIYSQAQEFSFDKYSNYFKPKKNISRDETDKKIEKKGRVSHTTVLTTVLHRKSTVTGNTDLFRLSNVQLLRL